MPLVWTTQRDCLRRRRGTTPLRRRRRLSRQRQRQQDLRRRRLDGQRVAGHCRREDADLLRWTTIISVSIKDSVVKSDWPVDDFVTAAWIKMPLGTAVSLGLRDIVFDVDPATPRKRAHPLPPNFGPCLLWPNGWMDEDAAWYGGRRRPRPHCTRRGPSSRERGTAAPLF